MQLKPAASAVSRSDRVSIVGTKYSDPKVVPGASIHLNVSVLHLFHEPQVQTQALFCPLLAVCVRQYFCLSSWIKVNVGSGNIPLIVVENRRSTNNIYHRIMLDARKKMETYNTSPYIVN